MVTVLGDCAAREQDEKKMRFSWQRGRSAESNPVRVKPTHPEVARYYHWPPVLALARPPHRNPPPQPVLLRIVPRSGPSSSSSSPPPDRPPPHRHLPWPVLLVVITSPDPPDPAQARPPYFCKTPGRVLLFVGPFVLREVGSEFFVSGQQAV